MKKVIFMAIAVLLTAGTAMAQLPTSKGNWFVNANTTEFDLSFGNGTSFDLGANAGFFIIDNLALMGGLNFSAFKYNDYKTNGFGINAGARYYFLEQSKGKFFAGGLIGVNKVKDADAAGSFTLNAGYAFFLNEHVALEPMINLWLPFSEGLDAEFSLGAAISVYF